MFNEQNIVYKYTRADAIQDGVLIDVSETAQQEGFFFPVALTQAVWDECVAWSADDNERTNTLQDQDGRLRDLITMLKRTIRASGSSAGPELLFSVFRTPRKGGRLPRRVELVSVCGPGDSFEPVLTILSKEEY